MKPAMQFTWKPLTGETWGDFEKLFGRNGANSGCWCMWWRTADRNVFMSNKGEANKHALEELVNGGAVPGVLGYRDGEPVGWCAVAPREEYPRLERSRNLKKVDETPVWSITCLFVGRGWRKQGVTEQLVASALDFVREKGGRTVEAYPARPKGETIAAFVDAGFASTYEKLGFREVVKRGSRPIMRLEL